jgi:hypothetical protein
MADLKEAIRVTRQVVDAIPEDYPDLIGTLNNLGLMLESRNKRTGDMADLVGALTYLYDAWRIRMAIPFHRV